jgi:phage terminase large subunit
MSSSKLQIADPVRFAETIFGVKLWRAQKDLLHAIVDNRRVACKSCHASGKTYAAALAALWFCARYADARVVVIAPGWRLVRSVFWSEVHGLLKKARYKLPTTKLNETELAFGPKNLILGMSTADSGRLQGQHSARLLVIIDETPAIDPDFWPSIEGTLSSGDSRLLILGNPTVVGGPFYDAFGRNRSSWTTFSISAFDTPNLAGLTVDSLLALPDAELDDNPYPFLTTRRWVRERHGEWFNGGIENSPLWASRVLGEFPTESTNALFPLSALEAARRPAVDPGRDVVVGVDVAGPGKDRTVAIAVAGGAILDVGTWTEPDARGPIVEFCRRWSSRLRLVNVDSIGIGFHVVSHVRDQGFRTVGINVATSAKDKERFSNSKAQRYWHLRERFLRGEISGLSDEMLAELAGIGYVIDPHGKICVEDKASVRATLGRSPDLAEALMLCLGEPAYEPFRYVPVGNSFTFHRTTPGSGRELTGREMDQRDDAEAAAQRQHRRFAAYSPRIGRKGVGW